MTQTSLRYIDDPLCGWCYAVASLIRAAREVLPVVGHGGGTMAGLGKVGGAAAVIVVLAIAAAAFAIQTKPREVLPENLAPEFT